MANVLTTTVDVDFSPYSDSSYRIIWEEDNERETTSIKELYVKLYPEDVPIKVASSGTLSSKGTIVVEEEKTLVFSGSDEVTFPYPNPYEVTIEKIGFFYSKTGTKINNVSIVFDAVKQVLRASSEGYGIVDVEFKVKAELFKFTFSGGSCPTDPFVPIPKKSPFNESLLIAMYPQKDTVSTHQLSPPACEKKSLRTNLQPGAPPPKIQLLIDPKHPVDLITVPGYNGKDIPVSCGCRVRHIPAIPSTVKINRGFIKELTNEGFLFQEVKETLTFGGSTSHALAFQSHNPASVTKVGTYINKWGEHVIPYFRKKGDFVTEVERIDAYSYTNPKTRIVGDHEIVAVDDFNNTLEIFGVIEVTYIYQYKLFEVELAFDYNSDAFAESYVTAIAVSNTDSNLTEANSIPIPPPSLDGST